MAQNLSYVQKELSRIKQEAADAIVQMRLLEKALSSVMAQGVKGGGVGSRPFIDVAANRALASGRSPAGTPVGHRAIVGKEVTPKFEGINREYVRLQAQIAQGIVASELLMKAEMGAAIAIEEKAAQAARAAASDAVTAEVNAKAIATQQAAVAAQAQLPKTLGQRVAAWKEEERAAKELAKAEQKVTAKMGELERGVTKAASDLTGGTGRGKGGAPQRTYTQQDLASIYSGVPGAATKVSGIAGKAGFTPKDIKSVTAYANSYTQLQYAVRDANGVMRKLVLTTDKAGNVFTSTQKQFRTFFGAIRRNVTEMIKWSAATLVVWGAIRKLGELLEIAIENETKLASIAVILGEEHVNLTAVFNSAAEAAAATGESIDGVLEGYVQAYRATGNIADQTERARLAQVLLTDALTLSKLSALTTAQSMDVLTGALRQAGLGFEEGYILLDKWVAVSKKANVSIETLAESFAITATSASNAGLTWDELNGIIATLAESTTLSATESGNAIRAFIGGFSTDLAVEELSRFGIAVEDSMGETRGFLDVMKEISAMFEQGIISESELNKISRAIGGRGARRGAQVATTIKNLGRAQEVANESAKAHGDAQRALGIQLDTVQTAITKLGNSFQKLARAMGSEGGVLDVAGGVLNIFTKLVDATASLVKNLGDMTPILAGIGVLFAVTSRETRGLFATNLIGGVGGFLNRATGGPRGLDIQNQRLQAGMAGGFVAGGGGGGQQGGAGGRFANRMLGPGFGRNAGSLIGQVAAGGFTAFSAVRDLQQGNQGGAVGSVVGGILGGLITGGSPVGIVIGTAAGEAFANATWGYKAEFSRFFATIFDEAEKAAGGQPVTDLAAATEGVFAEFGLGSVGLGKAIASISAKALNIGYQGGQVIGNITGGLRLGTTQEAYTYKEELPAARITAEQIALSKTLSGAGQTVFDLQARQEALSGFDQKPGAFEFAVTDEQEKLLEEYEDFLRDLEATQADIVRAGAVAGDITSKDLRDALEQIPKLQAILTKYEVAFGEEIRKVNDDVSTVTDTFEYWTNIVVNGSNEQVQHLNAVALEVSKIINAIEVAEKEGTPEKVVLAFDLEETLHIDEEKIVSIEEAWAEVLEIQKNIGVEAQVMSRAISQARIDIPSIVTLEIREEDLDTVLEAAEPFQDKFWEGFWSEGILTDFSEADLEATMAPVMLQAGKDGGLRYVEGWNTSLLQQVAADLIEQGIIKAPEADKRRGLQQLDIPSGQLPAVMARYQELIGITAEAGYIPDEETFAALFTDYIAMPITADLTLLNIAMQELIDVNKKELDGIYNLPTDASFYVPFTGYQLGFVNQGGGGGVAGLEGVTPEEEAVTDIVPAAISRNMRRQKIFLEQEILREEAQLERQRLLALEEKPAILPTIPTSAKEYYRDPFSGHREAQRPIEPEFEGITIPLPTLRELLDVGQNRGTDQKVLDYLKGLVPTTPLEPVPGGTFGAEALNSLRDLINSLFGLSGEDATITTKLQIESTTTTIVQLDGQVIANAIKPYLLNDEIRYEGTAGSAVKRFVI